MTDHATFTQQVRALVAENDRVPTQRTGDTGFVREPERLVTGTIALFDGERLVSDVQPCELWLDRIEGDRMTFSVRHDPLTVEIAADTPRAVVRDAAGEVQYETPASDPLPSVRPGYTVEHSPLNPGSVGGE